MKKVLLSLGLVAGCAGMAQAQTNMYGLKVGGSLTNFVGSSVDGGNYRFGVHGGLQADLGVNEHLSVHPEILYSMKGIKSEQTILGTTFTTKNTLHYIDVPVLARIKAKGFYVELGPQAGILFSAKGSTEGGGVSGSGDIKANYSQLDFGYAGGLGYQMVNGAGIGVRYIGSAINISSNSAYVIRNNGYQVYLSYMFGGR